MDGEGLAEVRARLLAERYAPAVRGPDPAVASLRGPTAQWAAEERRRSIERQEVLRDLARYREVRRDRTRAQRDKARRRSEG